MKYCTFAPDIAENEPKVFEPTKSGKLIYLDTKATAHTEMRRGHW